jgi:hypothetical protein
MAKLRMEQCELTYEGAFVAPAFEMMDSPGRLCDLLLDALKVFGCAGADLLREEEGEPSEQGVACGVDDLDTRVTLHGDRVEIHCASFQAEIEGRIATMLENLWSGMVGINPRIVAKTHSFLFEADLQILGASYQNLLNRLAQPPVSLPNGTETAVVYYLPAEPGRGFEPSS